MSSKKKRSRETSSSISEKPSNKKHSELGTNTSNKKNKAKNSDEKKSEKTKKQKETEYSSEEPKEETISDLEDEEDEENKEKQEKIDEEDISVDFEIVDPKNDDFFMVRNFLKTYLDFKTWDVSGMAQFIVSLETIASVIRIEGSEEIFGLIAVINLQKYKELKFVQQITKFLVSTITNNSLKEEFQKLLDDETQPVGLIINERMANVAPELGPHLHNILFDEIQSADKDEKERNLPPTFNFSKYILLSTTLDPVNKRKKQKTQTETETETETIYINPEEEFYHKESEFKYVYQVKRYDNPTKWTLRGNVFTNRSILAISNSKIEAILTAAHSNLCPPS